MKADELTVEEMEEVLGELYRQKFGGSLEELEKSSNPSSLPSKTEERIKELEKKHHVRITPVRYGFRVHRRGGRQEFIDQFLDLDEAEKFLAFEAGEDGLNPGLDRCTIMGVTEEEDIEIRFQDTPECWDAREEYRQILKAALGGGETIYKTPR